MFLATFWAAQFWRSHRHFKYEISLICAPLWYFLPHIFVFCPLVSNGNRGILLDFSSPIFSPKLILFILISCLLLNSVLTSSFSFSPLFGLHPPLVLFFVVALFSAPTLCSSFTLWTKISF